MSATERLLTIASSAFQTQWRAIEFWGAEYLSHPYEYVITAQTMQQDVDLLSLLYAPIYLTIGFSGNTAVRQGLIYGVQRKELSTDGWQTYILTIVPQLRFLADDVTSRVYAADIPLSIPEIVGQVLKNNDLNNFQWQLTQRYPKLSISVQYQESTYNYISRLLAKAGIYYYFIHDNNKHTMVLTDKPIPKAGIANSVAISEWKTSIGYVPSSTMSQRVDFTQPASLTGSQQQSPGTTFKNKTVDFHYGNHHPDDDKNQLDKENSALLQAQAMQRNYYSGISHSPLFQPGYQFNIALADDTQAGNFYLAGVQHHAIDHSQRGAGIHAEGMSQQYSNRFIGYDLKQPFTASAKLQDDNNDIDPRFEDCAFENHPFSPLLAITEPHISGLHMATVVGPKDTPIYTDKYGRLKIQFSWDNYSKNDENSFAWVRLKQPWAGQGYGFHTTPRGGQEVLVSFDHGSLDKPFILGTLGSQLPFTPDQTPTQSGFQSQSLDHDAPAPGGHQFLFEDDAKNPYVKLHSQRDLELNTGKNLTQQIGGNSTTAINDGNYNHQVGGKLTISADNGIHLINGQSRISVTSSDIILEADQIEFTSSEPTANAVNMPLETSPAAVDTAKIKTDPD